MANKSLLKRNRRNTSVHRPKEVAWTLSHQGSGDAATMTVLPTNPFLVIERPRFIPRPSKSQACDVRQTPQMLRALRRSADAGETTRPPG
jgi:hypothetical protein